jgi:hypothetical protein
MIGFNIQNFDYPLYHYFILNHANFSKTRLFVAELKNKANNLIDNINNNRGHVNVIYSPVRKYIDIFKIRHYDNKAKMTSLKTLGFNLRMENVQELPIEHTKLLTENEMNIVCDYLVNDLNTTEKAYEATLEDIELRNGLSSMFGFDMTNMNDAKIGQEIFVSIIKKRLGNDFVIGKTIREYIDLKDVIFDYIKFESKEFNAILNYLKNKRIHDTKNALTLIPFEELESVLPYMEIITKKKLQKNLNVVYKGFRYDFGVGGIHGSIKPGVYCEDDKYYIEDIDVTSYYPKLGIENELKPEHLGELFGEIYENIFNKRQEYPKKSPPNIGLKLALNGVYGKSNSIHSPFFDPKYTMAITINGQLLLCMLAEKIVDEIENVTVLQINTDGLTVRLKRKDADKLSEIKKRWEKFTRLNLENNFYSKMIIRDVNNYSAIDLKGNIKRKGGAFMYKVSPSELELHKNHSMLVVPKAIEKYFYEGISVEEFITNHNDVYDFFKRVKLPKSYRLSMCELVLEKKETFTKTGKSKIKVTESVKEIYSLQNLTRYYVANKGYTITKIMPPLADKTENRISIVEKNYLCKDCNDLRKVDLKKLKENINFDYYIQKAYKVINAILNGELEDEELDDNENE